MPLFEGTTEEFTKYIGAYARIKVMHIASKHKKSIGKCEECGVTNSLDAAHVKGKERPVLIANILSEFIKDGIINIDLNEFEEKFIEAHLPIESSIRILCKQCHWAYDRKNKTSNEVPEMTSLKNEAAIIEKLINKSMNKSKAFRLCYSRGITSLTNLNTIFSNINTAQQAWWLEPKNNKFKSTLHIILNDDKNMKLYVFTLPANTITNPGLYFRQRNDQHRSDCSDIYIPTDGTRFKEKNGFDFTPYKVDTISYE